jgi:hypothetical protein
VRKAKLLGQLLPPSHPCGTAHLTAAIHSGAREAGNPLLHQGLAEAKPGGGASRLRVPPTGVSVVKVSELRGCKKRTGLQPLCSVTSTTLGGASRLRRRCLAPPTEVPEFASAPLPTVAPSQRHSLIEGVRPCTTHSHARTVPRMHAHAHTALRPQPTRLSLNVFRPGSRVV